MFRRILLAIDESASSEAAVSFAAALARESSASVLVVHVNELLVGGRGQTVESRDQALELLENAVQHLRGALIPTTGSLYLASCFAVDARIASAARDWSADVIVLGSRRKRRFGRFAGKGIRERVIGLTALPVLIAPAPLQVTSGPIPELEELLTRSVGDFPSLRI
jgi:nucleotide-binding universal stress UspA family protein